MKILHTVEFYHPSVGGMQEVVKQLSERLVKLGHDVSVATTALSNRTSKLINGVKVIEFDIKGNYVRGLSGELDKYQELLLSGDFDIITNFAAQQWATDVALPLLTQIRAKKVFVPTGFSGLYLPPYKEYFELMQNWMQAYDANVFLSNDYRDINFAREHGIKNTLIIPNGAGEDEFLAQSKIDIRKKLGIPGDHFLILHVGSHTGAKGHQEAIEIFRKANIKHATFLMVANSFGGGCTKSCAKANEKLRKSFFTRLKDKQLIITELSRAETVAAYQAADLFLFPSNIECSPLVLFECMAAKTPFLTTDVGNAKEIISWSSAGELLPTGKEPNGNGRAEIRQSAKLLADLYNQSDQRQQMAQAGFEAWQRGFTWEKISRDYEKLYLELLED